MPTDKRARQKAGRVSRLEEQRAAQAKADRTRRIIRIVATVAVVVAIGFLISVLTNKDDGKKGLSAIAATTTTTAPPTTTTTYSDPAIAADVLKRTAPDTAPPPKDLAKDAVNATVLIPGTGREIAPTDTVTVNYKGVLADGTVFDDSYKRASPISGPLSQLIPGWQEGLFGKPVGSRVHLEVGSDKAYGAQASGKIPANSPLSFDIDIIDAVPAGAGG